VLLSKKNFDFSHGQTISDQPSFNREVKTASDVYFLVGFETEFILLISTNPIEPISIHSANSADSLRSGTTHAKVVAEMVEAIELSGIEVQIYHGEAAPGQVYYYFLHV
jgi:glutamine synthetase